MPRRSSLASLASVGGKPCATLILVLLCVRGVTAQGRATLDGVVVGPSGAPQPNITLVVTNAAGIDRRAVSDANGQFVFGGLQPGVYRLRTDDDTFAPFSQDQIALAGGQTQTIRVALQPRVPVAAPQTARATLQGTVIGPEGRPIGNTTIILTNPLGIDRRAVSEATGAYIFGGLQPGTYRLRIEDPGPGVRPFPAMELPLAPGEQRQFDVRLQPLPPPPATTTPPGGDERVVQIGPTRRERGRERTPPPEAAAVPAVTAPGGDFEAVPNRWNYQWAPFRRYQNESRQPLVVGRPFDPYNQNRAKADFPIGGSSSLFGNVNLQLNSAINPRTVGVIEPVSEVFSNNNFVGGAEIFRGTTVFEPKRWAVRGTVVGNVNTNTSAGNGRTYGVEEAFGEKRLAVLGPAFDFVSIRGGMQNFNSDFRGYLFVDNQLGVRLFGNARANRDQYNVVYFSMRNRDPVSQLHKFTSRNQDVVIANYYLQDFGTPGYTFMANLHINRDRGVPNDPHSLEATYAGFHGDGKWGPLSVSHAYYEVFGRDDDNAVARALSGAPAAPPVDVSARMAAVELSWDADWRRYRFSWFYASGDNAADVGKATGFDTITDNPNLAGGQFMFWDQQATKLNGLPNNDLFSEKFTLLPSLRSKFTDRANFVNPGLMLVNGGVDLRFSPKLRVVTNVSHVRLADPTVVRELLRLDGRDGFEDGTIGWDIGAGAKLRPFVNENLFVVLGFALLKPGDGLASALGSTQPLHSFVGGIQLAY